MFKRTLILLPLLASTCCGPPKPGFKDAYFTVATRCDLLPTVEAPDVVSSEDPCLIRDNDWRQLEFVAHTNLAHIQRELATLAAFKEQHRRGHGWTRIYLRKEHPTPFAATRMQYKSIMTVSKGLTPRGLGIGDIKSPVWHGFALDDASGWFIYGYLPEGSPDDTATLRPEAHVVQLGISSGHSAPSDEFARVVSLVGQEWHLVLVDWYAGCLVDTSSSDSVLAWARRYH